MDPQAPQQDEQVDSTETEKKSSISGLLNVSHWYIIVILILATLSFGSSAYLLAKAPQKKTAPNYIAKITSFPSPTFSLAQQATNTPTPTVLPTTIPALTITPTPDPIASWSAYVSTTSAYSIKYPPDWKAKATLQQDSKILEYVVFNPQNATASALSISISYGKRTYQEAIALRDQNGEKIKIASISGYKTVEQDSNQNVSLHAVFPINSNSIDLYAKKQYQDIFNKMWGSLKF